MKKTTIAIAFLAVLLLGVSTTYAAPLKIKEEKSKGNEAYFKPLYPKVPGEWEVVNKKVDGAYIINYLYDNDSILSISESNYIGKEINKSDATEVIHIDNVDYYYSPFRNRSGGNLTWVKNNILFEMNSVYFDRDSMLRYAKTIM